MSIEYLIFNFGGLLPSEETLGPEGYEPAPLGDVETVKQLIARYLPHVEWDRDDPLIGSVVDRGAGLTFFLGPVENGVVDSIDVQPYGGADVEAVLRQFCLPNQWYVLDSQAGAWIAPAELGQRGASQRAE